jgi:replicative DNA helicase
MSKFAAKLAKESEPLHADAEIELLTAVFLEPRSIHEVAALVQPEDFNGQDKRLTYQAMLELSQAGKPIDIMHVEQRLRTMGFWDRVGYDAISRFYDGTPMLGQIKHYAIAVKSAARRRSLRKTLELTSAQLDGEYTGTDECLNGILDSLWRLQADTKNSVALSMRDVLPAVMNEMCAERNRTGELIGLPTGLYDLDRCTGGIRLGEFWVVGALPGRGKTSLGLQFAVEAADRNQPSLEFSLEMSRNAIGRRFLAAMTDAGASMIRDPQSMSEERWTEMQESASHHIDKPLYVDDAASLTVQQLVALAKLYIRRHGIKLIVVDFLQLLKVPGKDRREAVSAAADGLRELAKQEHVAVVALSQLSRPKDLNEIPSMLSLKESGDIEAAAHTVLLLYQPVDDSKALTGKDEIIIGKQREGPTGTIPVLFDKRKLIFRIRTDEGEN